MSRYWFVLTGLLGALGVALAAWSAHGLHAFVPPDQLADAMEKARSASVQHMLHTLALFGVALWARQGRNAWGHLAGILFFLGVLGFSGGIYGLRLVAGINEGPLIYIVPWGGTCLILGWLALAVAGWRERD
jgi:uncharacterized membrane protein YgdD (TMEM256/DUF423 family)